jgi:hypothetical protein
MLNVSVHTSLDREEAFDRAVTYFIRENNLHLVELIAHLHSRDGASEIRVSGEVESAKRTLFSQINHLEYKFEFELVYYGLHLHGSAEDDIGHLMVAVRSGDPVEVAFESMEMDFAVHEFTDSLPTVKVKAGER